MARSNHSAIENIKEKNVQHIGTVVENQDRTRSAMQTRSLKDLRMTVEEQQDAFGRLNIGNYATFHSHPRILNTTDFGEQFEQRWMPLLSSTSLVKHWAILPTAFVIWKTDVLEGWQLPVQDAVLRVLLARSLEKKPLRLLEIGSLFGASLLPLYMKTAEVFTLHLGL